MGIGWEDKTGKVAGSRQKVINVTLRSFYLNPQGVGSHYPLCLFIFSLVHKGFEIT